jgi:hypothetical protein
MPVTSNPAKRGHPVKSCGIRKPYTAPNNCSKSYSHPEVRTTELATLLACPMGVLILQVSLYFEIYMFDDRLHKRYIGYCFLLLSGTFILGSIHIWGQRSSYNRTWFIGP